MTANEATPVPPLGLLWPAQAVALLRALWLKEKDEVFTTDDWATLTSLMRQRLPQRHPRYRLEDEKERELRIVTLQAKAKIDHTQKTKAQELLTHLLGGALVRTVFLAAATGKQFQIDAAFWYSTSAPLAWEGKQVQWLFGEPPLWSGRVLVDKASLVKAVESWDAPQKKPQEEPTGDALAPTPGERKQDFILRALGLRAPRPITADEGRVVARLWLRAKGLPDDDEDVAAEGRRMTAAMRGLAPKVATKPAQPDSEAVAKSPRSRGEVRAKR